MKRFTLNLKQMLVAGLCLVGLSANAQFSQTIDRYSNTDYSCKNATFKLSEVATTLGTDTATLIKALDSWYEATDSGYVNDDTKLFGVDAGDGTVSDAYNGASQCDGRGSYWLNPDGTLGAWGDDAVYNSVLEYDAATDVFSIPVGNHPTFGDSISTTANLKFIFNFNSKQATFAITYTVKPFVVPAVSNIFVSKLNVLGSQSASITRTSMQGYDATSVKFDAKTIAEALGITTDDVSNGLSQILYMQAIDSLGVRDDSLTNVSTANAPGWWMKNTVYPQGHEQQGENSGLLGAASYDANDALFAEFSYADGDSIQANVGQYPGTCKVGDKYVADFYVLYGDKAYKLTLNTEIVKAETTEYPQLNVVGTQDYTVKVTADESDYQAHAVTIDLEAVATALGTTTDALAINAPADEKEFYVGNTAGNQGYWFDEAGFVCAWGETAATFVENSTDSQYDSYNCGVYPGIQDKVGNKYLDKIYFVNGNDCYIINFNFEIVAAEVVDQSTWKVVAKRPVVAQVIPDPSTDYHNTTLDYTFTTDQINELIGTSSPTMYVMLADSLQNETTKYALAAKYLCDPAPGAWLGDKGQGAGWGNNAYVGVCYDLSSGKFTIYEMPGKDLAIGTTYTAPIYMVNDETHQMVEFDLTIQWVNEVVNTNIVGSENLEGIIASMDESEISIDITKAATALSVTSADILSPDNYYFSGLLASGLWSSGATAAQGLTFNWDGSVEPGGYGKYSMALNEDGTKIKISCDEEIADESTFKSQPVIGFKNGNDVYAYYITLYTEKSKADGISNVSADVKNGKIYSINGVQVMKPVKGLYIQDGKKFIVK